jgi:DNA-binding MarR family transcriptional regulator
LKVTTHQGEPMQSVKLDDLPGYLFRCASNISNASFQSLSGETTITPRQFAVLLTIRNHGPQTQRQLSAQTRIDSSTMHEMVSRMIKRELLVGNRSRSVKRGTEFSLSEQGESTLWKLIPIVVMSQSRVLEILPVEYRRILVHCLQVIIDHNPFGISAEEDGAA